MKFTIVTRTVVDLDDLPDDIKFIGIDQDGTTCGFPERPHLDNAIWYPQGDLSEENPWNEIIYAETKLGKIDAMLIDVDKARKDAKDILLEGVVNWEREE